MQMNKLEIQSLNKKYAKKWALKNCSFSIEGGEIVGVIGKNGAGKTTMFNCIAGNILKTNGEILFNDEKITFNSKRRKDFGILIKPAFYDYMTGYEFLNVTLKLDEHQLQKEEILHALELVGLHGAEFKKIKSYSFGMKQRLGFALALLSADKLLMLDEPFVGLDINGRDLVKKHIKKLAKEKDIPIIFSDHNLDEVMELCTRVILLSDGEIVYDGELDVFKEDITIEVADTKELRDEHYVIIDDNKVSVNKRFLDYSLRDIMKKTVIKNIENINILNKLLNEGGMGNVKVDANRAV